MEDFFEIDGVTLLSDRSLRVATANANVDAHDARSDADVSA